MIANHLKQDLGLIFIPPGLRNIGTLLGLLKPYVPKEILDEYITALCLETDTTGYDCRTCSAKGETLQDDLISIIEARNVYEKKGPVITLLVADSLEHAYGVAETQAQIIDMMTNSRNKGNIIFIVGIEGSDISQRITHFVNLHWRVRAYLDSYLLCGIFPRTEFYIFTTESIDGANIPTLVSLV